MTSSENTIYVTNISLNADEKAVSNFFAFCGIISNIYIFRKEDKDYQEAVVTFDTESAAKTALLLTNALIVDRPISVISAPVEEIPAHDNSTNSKVLNESDIEQKVHDVPDHERTKTSVIASLIAGGYQLGSDTIAKAKDYDEEHMIRTKIGMKVNAAKESDIGKSVLGTTSAAYDAVKEKVGEIDQLLGISEKSDKFIKIAKEDLAKMHVEGNKFVDKNPMMKKGLTSIKDIGSKISQKTSEIKNEVNEKIAEQKSQTTLKPVPSIPSDPQEEKE